MLPFYQALFDRFHELNHEAVQALDAIPADGLDWQPGEQMNSVSVLITHLTGAERFLLGDVIMGDSSNRNREAEFKVTGVTKHELIDRLTSTEAYIKSVLEKLTLDDLEQQRTHPRRGDQVSVAWAILHALEHAAMHVGHIQMTVQLFQLPEGEG